MKFEINESVVYVAKQKIRKTDPCYDKVNVTTMNENKICGIREKTNRPANIHTRKIKRIRKKFPLQDPDQPDPGASGSTNKS